MNGFIVRPLEAAVLLFAMGAVALPATAGQLAKRVPVTLTILPGVQTRFNDRAPAGDRFSLTDDTGRPLDMTDVHVYVHEDGIERRYRDRDAAQLAISKALHETGGPVQVTIVF